MGVAKRAYEIRVFGPQPGTRPAATALGERYRLEHGTVCLGVEARFVRTPYLRWLASRPDLPEDVRECLEMVLAERHNRAWHRDPTDEKRKQEEKAAERRSRRPAAGAGTEDAS